MFAVYAGTGDAPAMLGSYAVENGSLVFRPRFPIAPGMHVRAVFRNPAGGAVEASFDSPAGVPPASTTRVEHVYPSAGTLPENELKLYIYFSAPMSKGQAWQRVHLLDEKGTPVELAFLEIEQELWDPGNTRLTVLFDPGRIKRGLFSLKEAGPALEAGKRYTLRIDREWADGRGAPLTREFRKEFRVGPADRTPPDAAKWRIVPPRAGTSEPLVLEFPEPLDFALLQHLIEVRDGVGAIAGSVSVDRDETRWSFTPREPWKPGAYRIVAQTTLEDLAGNHIGRAFDVDVFERVTRKIERESVSLPFRTRKQ